MNDRNARATSWHPSGQLDLNGRPPQSEPLGSLQSIGNNRGIILVVLLACAFVFPLTMFVVPALLVDLSADLGVSIGHAGQLVTLAAIPAAALALIIGPLSDRYGRKPTLVAGAAFLGVGSLGSALAPTYELMVATRVLSGVGGAAMGPAVFAAVADIFSYRRRGRIYGYITAATTISMILGVPAATLMAAHWHWRWAFAAVGLVTLASVALLLRLYPASSSEPSPSTPSSERKARNWLAAAYRPVLQTPTARAVLGSSFAMSIGTMAFQTYVGAFFITQYAIGTGDLAPILGVGGLGVLVGAQAAARLGERIGHRPIMAGSVLVAAVFVIVQVQTTTSVLVAAVLNFLTWVPMGMRFTSASTIISEAVPTARGTMNAVNAAFFNAGMVLGAFLGGVVVEGAGYAPLGLLMLASAATSAALVALFVAERNAEEP
jgi:DHA1 family inner membrane transport protein